MQTTFGSIHLEEFTTTPTLLIGDAVKILKLFPSESIDLIYSDHAYDDMEIHRSVGTTTRLKQSDGSNMEWYETIPYEDVIPIYSKILKKGKHYYDWRPSLNTASWKNWSKLLSLDNGLLVSNDFTLAKVLPAGKPFMGMGYSYRSTHECLMFCIKSVQNKVQLNDLSLPDIIDERWLYPRSNERIHDSEKPLEIARKVIENSSQINELVLEPFAGSFQSGIANHRFNLNRRMIGIEKNTKIAKKTIDYFKDSKIELNVIDSFNG